MRRQSVALERLAQQSMLVQHALGRGQYDFAFGRETHIIALALDDNGLKLLLQRPQGIGQRWLRNMACLRRPTEMAVLVQSHQITQARK